MRRIQITSAFLLIIAAQALFAKPPVRYMSQYTLGIEYSAAYRGQLITEQEVNGLERMHILKIHYSPFEFVQFYLGGGADRFEVEYPAKNIHFDGNYGFSPALGLTLNSPALVREILRASLNFDMLYLNSEDDRDYKYSGAILDPSLGVIIHAGRLIDIEAGVKGHFIAGTMQQPGSDAEFDFSNSENIRGYSNFTLCSPNGAFAQVNFDVSPKAEKELEDGPVEMTLGFSIGVLITQDMTNRELREKSSKYFPGFEDMKEKEEKMGEEIDK